MKANQKIGRAVTILPAIPLALLFARPRLLNPGVNTILEGGPQASRLHVPVLPR